MLIREHLFKNKLPLMNRALDAYAMRQQVTAKNIANATSPNYRPERVKFEEEFDKATASSKGLRTAETHIPIGGVTDGEVAPEAFDPSIPKPEVFFSGESHVNVDKEMSELAQNQIRFRFVSRLTARYFSGLQNAIKGSQV